MRTQREGKAAAIQWANPAGTSPAERCAINQAKQLFLHSPQGFVQACVLLLVAMSVPTVARHYTSTPWEGERYWGEQSLLG